jgi:hypothetical protein
MKSPLIVFLIVITALLFIPAMVNAQSEQTASTSAPLSQPLVREGTLATKLADALKMGPAANEAEAESLLSAAGIAPKNGWIADYPVTPDIAGELQTSISDAADVGGIPQTKDSAEEAFQDVMASFNLAVSPGTSESASNYTSAPVYPESEVINNYYYDEGPPVVTYYAPPPAYYYLYSWVPYPFWWWNVWFPGFFVLADFNIGFHGHHGHHRWHGDGDRGFVSNHFRDPSTGRMKRIDPANRANGGTFADRGGRVGWTSASARSGAQSIVTNSLAFRESGKRFSALPRVNGMSGPISRNRQAFTGPVRNASAGTPPARTYRGSGLDNTRRSFVQNAYGTQPTFAPASVKNRTSGQSAYRTPRTFDRSMGRSFTAPSQGFRGGRSFTSPSGGFAGSRSFNAPSGGLRSFSAPSAGRSGGGASFGPARGSFSGGGRVGSSFGGGRGGPRR